MPPNALAEGTGSKRVALILAVWFCLAAWVGLRMARGGFRSSRCDNRVDVNGPDSSRVLESSNVAEVGDEGRASLARASASDTVRRVLLLPPLQPRRIAVRFCRAGRLG